LADVAPCGNDDTRSTAAAWLVGRLGLKQIGPGRRERGTGQVDGRTHHRQRRDPHPGLRFSPTARSRHVRCLAHRGLRALIGPLRGRTTDVQRTRLHRWHKFSAPTGTRPHPAPDPGQAPTARPRGSQPRRPAGRRDPARHPSRPEPARRTPRLPRASATFSYCITLTTCRALQCRVLPRGPQFPHKSAAGRRPHRKPTDETELCGTRRHGRYDDYKTG
jgi:hypothetical protein